MAYEEETALLGGWRRRSAALMLLSMLVVSSCAGAAQQTRVVYPTSTLGPPTTMELIAWTTVMQWPSGQQRPPDVKTFDKIITNQALVRAVQARLNALQRGVTGDCSTASPTDRYDFRFATSGAATQDYSGNLDCETWTVTTGGVSVPVDDPDSTTLDGYNFMATLHQLTGMPVPSWWSGTLLPS
ncbi:MAG: hypothetical protein ACLQUY_00565 [Ktedonobacterales bacterium]